MTGSECFRCIECNLALNRSAAEKAGLVYTLDKCFKKDAQIISRLLNDGNRDAARIIYQSKAKGLNERHRVELREAIADLTEETAV